MAGVTNRVFICPFYSSAGRQKNGNYVIRCEDKSRVILPDKKAFYDFIDNKCCNGCRWKECSIAQAMTQYYEKRFERYSGPQKGEK